MVPHHNRNRFSFFFSVLTFTPAIDIEPKAYTVYFGLQWVSFRIFRRFFEFVGCK